MRWPQRLLQRPSDADNPRRWPGDPTASEWVARAFARWHARPWWHRWLGYLAITAPIPLIAYLRAPSIGLWAIAGWIALATIPWRFAGYIGSLAQQVANGFPWPTTVRGWLKELAIVVLFFAFLAIVSWIR